MNTPGLDFEVIEQDGFTCIELEGSLTRATHEELGRQLAALAEAETRGVALGFGAVDFMDSTGMGACSQAADVVGRLGARPFVAYGMSQFVSRMWTMVGLDRKIPVFENRNEALARMKEMTA